MHKHVIYECVSIVYNCVSVISKYASTVYRFVFMVCRCISVIYIENASSTCNLSPFYLFLIRVIDGNCIFSNSLALLANIPQGKKVGKHTPLKSGGLKRNVPLDQFFTPSSTAVALPLPRDLYTCLL